MFAIARKPRSAGSVAALTMAAGGIALLVATGVAPGAGAADPPPATTSERPSGERGPAEVFVPTEKIGAGAVVAFPVDI